MISKQTLDKAAAVKSLSSLWQRVYGYFPNASKTWWIVKPNYLSTVVRIFEGIHTGVNIIVEGKHHLGQHLDPTVLLNIMLLRNQRLSHGHAGVLLNWVTLLRICNSKMLQLRPVCVHACVGVCLCVFQLKMVLLIWWKAFSIWEAVSVRDGELNREVTECQFPQSLHVSDVLLVYLAMCSGEGTYHYWVEFDMTVLFNMVLCRLRWLGRVGRMIDNCLLKWILFEELLSAKLFNGLKLRWRGVIYRI